MTTGKENKIPLKTAIILIVSSFVITTVVLGGITLLIFTPFSSESMTRTHVLTAEKVSALNDEDQVDFSEEDLENKDVINEEAQRYFDIGKENFITYYREFKTKNFLEYFQKAVELEPNNYEFVQHLALAYEVMEDYDSAIAYYLEGLKLEENPSLYRALARLYSNTKQHNLALEYYNKYIELDPDDYIMYSSRAVTLIQLEDYKNAFKDIKKSKQLDKEEFESLLRLRVQKTILEGVQKEKAIANGQTQLKNSFLSETEAIFFTMLIDEVLELEGNIDFEIINYPTVRQPAFAIKVFEDFSTHSVTLGNYIIDGYTGVPAKIVH